MVPEGRSGQRLLASTIDAIASNDPHRIWATVPVEDEDLAKGYRSVSYKMLANAVNHASWWLKRSTADDSPVFETLAYAGPSDLRYPILAVAAVKCGKQLLLLSESATRDAQRSLLRETRCSLYLHAASSGPRVHEVLETESNVPSLTIPELHVWLFNGQDCEFIYDKTWEEANSDPWLIMHTSGTTGTPRPIVYTNWMMTQFDAADIMPDVDPNQETMNDQMRNSRFYTPIPPSHFVGISVALQWTTFLNTTLVVGPPGPVVPSKMVEILHVSEANGVVMPPSLIEAMCNDPIGLGQLRKLDYIYFAGAPLSRPVAEKLTGHCKIQPAMGSTEAGAYFLQIRNDDDWEYYRYRPAMGVDFEQRTEELYELVFRRQPELERWQHLFKLYPELDEFPTKDLWRRHPSKPDLWRYAGRTDDLVILSHGHNLDTSAMEAEVQKSPVVKTALVGGQGRVRPFLIVELHDSSSLLGNEKEEKLTHVWPYVSSVNRACSDFAKLTRSLVVFTDAERPLPRTAKDTVLRSQSFALYESEINSVYENFNDSN